MVKVSGVPYEVDLPEDVNLVATTDKVLDELADKMYNIGYNFAIDTCIAHLEQLHQTHKELHNYYRFAAIQLQSKRK
jgi:hypothetical protein